MTDDSTFERDLRAGLERLGREPAPERLVARIAEIPSRQPSAYRLEARSGLSPRSIGSGLGLLVAVLAIAVIALVLRPSGPGPVIVGGSPSLAVVPSESPSLEPSASPSDEASVAPSASASPSSTPAPTPNPTAVPVPAGFQPISATFVSATVGWVLGSVPCDATRCPAIVHTTDGGATWARIAAPKTTVGRSPVDETSTGISAIRFANAKDGWVFGPQLWATHDGGAKWAHVSIGGLPKDSPVRGLEAARGSVHAVVYDGGQDFRIASAKVATNTWTLASVRVPVGAGPDPRPQLVLSGTGGWVLENDRTVVSGAQLRNGSWVTWKPVCLDVVGPAVLAASSATNLVAACDVGALSDAKGDHLFASHDAGASFAEVGAATPLGAAAVIATPGVTTIVIGGTVDAGSELFASYDGGQTWSGVLPPAAATFADLGFTTPTQGIVIQTEQSGTSRMLMSHDAGKTWTPVAF
jgi:photosystem II stability/assembly factor-like uncharacterized protein